MCHACYTYAVPNFVLSAAAAAVHPDPFDSYALATYAAATNRTSELMPLEHIDKSRDFAGPFAVPGSKLFEDFCRDLVHRYCLDNVVAQDKVGWERGLGVSGLINCQPAFSGTLFRPVAVPGLKTQSLQAAQFLH
jgi:hypothetical protein